MNNYPIPGFGGHATGYGLESHEYMPAYTPGGSDGKTGYLSYSKCELGHCGEHVPEAGGGVHFHADPFGTDCMYSHLNYTKSDGT